MSFKNIVCKYTRRGIHLPTPKPNHISYLFLLPSFLPLPYLYIPFSSTHRVHSLTHSPSFIHYERCQIQIQIQIRAQKQQQVSKFSTIWILLIVCLTRVYLFLILYIICIWYVLGLLWEKHKQQLRKKPLPRKIRILTNPNGLLVLSSSSCINYISIFLTNINNFFKLIFHLLIFFY